MSPLIPASSVLQRHMALWLAQGRRCYLCGGRLRDLPHPSDGAPTRDHVKPRVTGGRKRRNVLLAHAGCNRSKGARPPKPCELIYCDAIHLLLETPRRERLHERDHEDVPVLQVLEA